MEMRDLSVNWTHCWIFFIRGFVYGLN